VRHFCVFHWIAWRFIVYTLLTEISNFFAIRYISEMFHMFSISWYKLFTWNFRIFFTYTPWLVPLSHATYIHFKNLNDLALSCLYCTCNFSLLYRLHTVIYVQCVDHPHLKKIHILIISQCSYLCITVVCPVCIYFKVYYDRNRLVSAVRYSNLIYLEALM
jgi:hypothetical protein